MEQNTPPNDLAQFPSGMLMSLFWSPAPSVVSPPMAHLLDGTGRKLLGHVFHGGMSRETAHQAARLAIDGVYDALDSLTAARVKAQDKAPEERKGPDLRRISEIVGRIKHIWEQHPDWRLGQLLSSALRDEESLAFIDDSTLELRLKELEVRP